MKRDIPIFSFEMAQALLAKGFVITNMAQNSKFPSKIVFYFPQTKELVEHLKEEYGINIK